jgi:hypothetical protein
MYKDEVEYFDEDDVVPVRLSGKKSAAREERRIKKSEQVHKVIDHVNECASNRCVKKGETIHFSQTDKNSKKN